MRTQNLNIDRFRPRRCRAKDYVGSIYATPRSYHDAQGVFSRTPYEGAMTVVLCLGMIKVCDVVSTAQAACTHLPVVVMLLFCTLFRCSDLECGAPPDITYSFFSLRLSLGAHDSAKKEGQPCTKGCCFQYRVHCSRQRPPGHRLCVACCLANACNVCTRI